MTAPSLALLKGGAAALDQELTKPAAAEPEVVEETVVIYIDTLSGEELDEIVAMHDLTAPDWWVGADEADKRKWLNEQFAGEEESTAPILPNGTGGGTGTITIVTADVPSSTTVATPDLVAETKPAKAMTASKSQTVAKAKAVDGEIVDHDQIADMIHEVENLKKQEALEQLAKVVENSDENFFRMGGLLSLIQINHWFHPYASFRDFVEKEHGIEYRKATYSTSIYNSLAEAEIPWEKVKGIGWTKLKVIAPILTLENVDLWVDKAKTNNKLTLIELVREHKKKDKQAATEDLSSKIVTTLTFKVHEDQKETIKAAIEKAKASSGTQFDPVALEFVCLDYLGSMSMKQRLLNMGIEKALEALEKAYPNVNIEVEITETEVAA